MGSPSSSKDLFENSDTDSDDTVDLSTPATKSASQFSSQDVNGLVNDLNKKSISLPIQVTSAIREHLPPLCKYGTKCYRKNPSHLAEFRHPVRKEESVKKNEESSDNSVNLDSPSTKRPCLNPTLETDRESSQDDGRRLQSTSHDISSVGVASKQRSDDSIYKCAAEIIEEAKPLSFLLTKVSGIDDRRFNASGAVDIKDLLCSTLGELQRSVQFNYCIDIPWVVSRYPKQFQSKPLLIVHGSKGGEKTGLDMAASRFPHVRLCQAPLEIAYGTHHTKMMFLEYDVGLRVVIHTANLVEGDWHQKTQGVWVSNLYPKLPADQPGAASTSAASVVRGDSPTRFKQDLLAYLSGYGRQRHLEEWITVLKEYDMSSTRVHLIGSVPGRHSGQNKNKFGHLKLRQAGTKPFGIITVDWLSTGHYDFLNQYKQILQSHGPQSSSTAGWPVIGQFSSVGTLGASADSWMCSELLESLSATSGAPAVKTLTSATPKLQLIFPSADNVRCSLEGYMAGGSIPYSLQTARKQPYFNTFLHQWKSSVRGRSRASPHIKTYTRVSPDSRHMAWFLVTSANMSKAAWGALEKNNSQLMIRSYELGVLFLPQNFDSGLTFRTSTQLTLKPEDKGATESLCFPLPYDLPLTPYSKEDRPWIWDIAYTDKPDSHGNQWSPP